MKELNYFDEIYQYENGDMNYEQKSNFETELLTNEEIQLEYAIYKNVEKAFKDKDLFLFHDKLEKIEQMYRMIEELFNRSVDYLYCIYSNKLLKSWSDTTINCYK